MPPKTKQLGPSAAALAKFEKDFEKAFGADRLFTPAKPKFTIVSTGSIDLDDKLGTGGLVLGRIYEAWGPGEVGKTTHAYVIAANHQQACPNKLIGWLDVERTFNTDWAQKNGLNTKLMKVVKPKSAEEVSDMATKMLASGLFSFIVIDSVGGMMGQREMDRDAEEATVAEVARVVTRLIKKSVYHCDVQQCTLYVINQPRANISSYGGGTTTGGGFALKMLSSAKLKYRKTNTKPYTLGSGNEENYVGYELAITIERNKFAPPMKTAVFSIFNQDTDTYGPLGIDRVSEAFIIGTRRGIIQKLNASSYQLPGYPKPIVGQGKVIAALRSDPDVMEQIRDHIVNGTLIENNIPDELPIEDIDVDAIDDEALLDDFKTGIPTDMQDVQGVGVVSIHD